MTEKWLVCGGRNFGDMTQRDKLSEDNQIKQMLEEGKPDLVVAFPGGRGTENMKKLAREAGVEVIEFNYVS